MANLLLLAALAMLDVLPVRVPSAILTRATNAGTAGRASGAFLMGAMSGLVAAPCSAPVMAAVLTWVTTTKSAALGFRLSVRVLAGNVYAARGGGLSSGAMSRLPRAGFWMVWIKRIFALVMIGAAEYYLIEMGKLIL
jgi:thiol:disulfide interchange protein DsbD